MSPAANRTSSTRASPSAAIILLMALFWRKTCEKHHRQKEAIPTLDAWSGLAQSANGRPDIKRFGRS